MKVIVDVDCVVADFVGAVLDLIDHTDRSEANEFNWWNKTYSPEDAKHIDNTLSNNSHFWQSLPLMPNAVEGVQFLRDNGHHIKWVTAPYRTKYGWCSDRRLWLEKHFRVRDNGELITFTHDKKDVQATAIIDDFQHHVDTWERENKDGLGFLFASELNLNSRRDRVTWKDIIEMRFFRYDKNNT